LTSSILFADGVTLRCIGHVLFRATEFVATGALAAVIVALLYVLVVSMERQTIDIRTMSVPKEWEDQGYTSSVAAARLKDTINQIVADADSAMVPPRFGSEGPEVEIHEVWFHPDAIAGWLGTWLGLRRQQDVSGEITIEGCRAQLRIRYNGTLLSDHPSVDFDCGDKEIRDGGQTRETSEVKRNKGANSEPPKRINAEQVSTLFLAPAGEILTRTDPYLVAVACKPYKPEVSCQIVDFIIGAHEPFQWHDLAWAYNLRGLDKEREQRKAGNFKWANVELEDFNRALAIDPSFTVAGRNRVDIKKLQVGEQENTAANPPQTISSNWEQSRQVVETILAALNAYAGDPDVRIDRAEEMHRDQDDSHAADQYNLAVTLGRKVISSDPDNVWGYVLAGAALFSFSEFHRGLAQEELKEAEEVERLEARVCLAEQSR
jgi:hypothetical protein